MHTGKTVFSQLMTMLPEYEFDKCIGRYKGNLDFFRLFNLVHQKRAYFVTRAKDNMPYKGLSPVIYATSKQDKTRPLPLHSSVDKHSAKAAFGVISVDYRVV